MLALQQLFKKQWRCTISQMRIAPQVDASRFAAACTTASSYRATARDQKLPPLEVAERPNGRSVRHDKCADCCE